MIFLSQLKHHFQEDGGEDCEEKLKELSRAVREKVIEELGGEDVVRDKCYKIVVLADRYHHFSFFIIFADLKMCQIAGSTKAPGSTAASCGSGTRGPRTGC